MDAIATKRFDAQTGADREVQRILLELLNQMDGFDQTVNVKVIMATNRQDTLDPALAIYSDVVLHPSFPQSDLDRVKKIQLANIQQEKVQPFTMGLRVLPQLLFGLLG